eukprot:947588-Rhodomonas_salina.4
MRLQDPSRHCIRNVNADQNSSRQHRSIMFLLGKKRHQCAKSSKCTVHVKTTRWMTMRVCNP